MGNTAGCCFGKVESNTSKDQLITSSDDPSQEGTSIQHPDAQLHAVIKTLRGLLPQDLLKVTFSRVSHGASFGADQQLLDQLNRSRKFHLEEANLNECQIIFVFCTINTRIESDMKAAMEQIPESAGDKPVILVLMHHTRDINFTTMNYQREWKEKYERVQLDVEVLFHRSDEGLLRCEKNNQAVEEIKKYLKENMIQNRK